jgi:hypothetical protein
MKNTLFSLFLLLLAYTATAQITVTPAGPGLFTVSEPTFDNGPGFVPGRARVAQDSFSVQNFLHGKVTNTYERRANLLRDLVQTTTERVEVLSAWQAYTQAVANTLLNLRYDSTFVGAYRLFQGPNPTDVTFFYRAGNFNQVRIDATVIGTIRPRTPRFFEVSFNSNAPNGLANTVLEFVLVGNSFRQPFASGPNVRFLKTPE